MFYSIINYSIMERSYIEVVTEQSIWLLWRINEVTTIESIDRNVDNLSERTNMCEYNKKEKVLW